MTTIPLLGPTDDPAQEVISGARDMLAEFWEKHEYGMCTCVYNYEKVGDGAVLGKGQTSVVSKAKLKDGPSDEVMAVKKYIFREDFLETQDFPTSYIREIAALKYLQCDNVIRLVDVAAGVRADGVFLVMEYCELELGKLLEQLQQPLALAEIKTLMSHLLTGLACIHKNGFVHRDINPTNLLINSSGVLKIADFGSSRSLEANGRLTPNIGTMWYRAPEILFEFEKYTNAVDLWSAGCVFAEMLKNKPLFPFENHMTLISEIIDLIGTPNEECMPGYSKTSLAENYTLKLQPYNMISKRFKEFSKATVALLKVLLNYNPVSRSTADFCLTTSYFNEDPKPLDPSSLYESIISKRDGVTTID